MRFHPLLSVPLAAAAILLVATAANAVSIDLVTVANPGNAPDTRYANPGYGAVTYTYQMGKFEITAGQYTEFLNAVAKADPYGLYDPKMDQANSVYACNIQRGGSAGNYAYSVTSDWADRPVNYLNFRRFQAGQVARRR